ncbi:MAG: hypothetical protein KAI72_00375 [Candidatus Pacebacteria bacterium]|nr:hypothetical protein [Candidatus Paceibacterota bacterium]
MGKKRRKGRWFTMLDRRLLKSADWQSLTHAEMITYIYVKHNYNGSNNGEIPLKYSELKVVFAPATLSKALKGLREKEWIERTQHGGMYRYFCLYKLTGKYDVIK